MTVGLEIDTNVELLSGMMQVFDTSRGAVDLELQVLLDVVGSRAVGIGSLHHTNLDRVSQARLADKITEERGDKRGDPVAIKKAEHVVLVLEVVDNAVGISVEGAATVVRSDLGGWRSTLICLDVVGAALQCS